jgi:hypothetical protein
MGRRRVRRGPGAGPEPAESAGTSPPGDPAGQAATEPKRPDSPAEVGPSKGESQGAPGAPKAGDGATPDGPPATAPAGTSPPAEAPVVPADPIKEQLDKARAAYQDEAARLRQALLDQLDKREEAARTDGNKKQVDEVKAQREAFADRGELPKMVPTDSYRQGLKSAVATLEVAYNAAIKDYTKASEDKKAQAVEDELKEFRKESESTSAKKPVVVATWVHEVRMNGKIVSRSTHRMYSNGHINTPDSPATWKLRGNLLILRWPNARAPGGAWEDVCTLSANGMAYVGKNQNGATLVGVRIANTDPAKKP